MNEHVKNAMAGLRQVADELEAAFDPGARKEQDRWEVDESGQMRDRFGQIDTDHPRQLAGYLNGLEAKARRSIPTASDDAEVDHERQGGTGMSKQHHTQTCTHRERWIATYTSHEAGELVAVEFSCIHHQENFWLALPNRADYELAGLALKMADRIRAEQMVMGKASLPVKEGYEFTTLGSAKFADEWLAEYDTVIGEPTV